MPSKAKAEVTRLIERLNKVPPCICRMYARRGHHALTCREISDLSGISKSTVASMSKARTWEGRSVDTVEAFANACGVDIFNPHKVVKYFRNTKQVHLRKAHPAQVRMFMEIWSTGGH